MHAAQVELGVFLQGVGVAGQGDAARADHVQVEFVFEFAGADGAAGIFCGEADDDVAQLAHVAGEVVVLPQALGIGREGEGGHVRLRGKLFAEMLQQRQLVLGLFAQGRHVHGKHRQAMVEVAAEAAFAHFLAQVAVGGGDDAGVGKTAAGFADALEFAVFQHAQQLGLEFHGEFADLVEEQGAVARILEVTGMGLGRAGEGALGVAEQGGLDQGGGDGRTVEGEIGFATALSPLMQALRHQFLAAAGFALDQHGEGRVRVELDLVAQAVDGEAGADDAAGVVGRFRTGRGGHFLLESQGGLQGALDLLRFGRFGDEVDGAEGAGVTGVGLVVLPGQHQDAGFLGVVEQIRDEGETLVRFVLRGRQTEIDQCQRGCFVELRQHALDLLAAFGDENFEVVGEHEMQGVGDERVVVDDEQGGFCGFHWESPVIGAGRAASGRAGQARRRRAAGMLRSAGCKPPAASHPPCRARSPDGSGGSRRDRAGGTAARAHSVNLPG